MVKNEYKHLNTASTICSNMDQKDQHDVLAILFLLQLFFADSYESIWETL